MNYRRRHAVEQSAGDDAGDAGLPQYSITRRRLLGGTCLAALALIAPNGRELWAAEQSQPPAPRNFSNPGVGWETSNRVRKELARDLPHSSIAYFKYYVKDLLSDDGSPDLRKLEIDLRRSQRSGQQLALRLMVSGEEAYSNAGYFRRWGVRSGFHYRYFDGGYAGSQLWTPDLADRKAQKILLDLVSAIGRKYGGDPRLAHVDLGLHGLWGEGHFSNTFPRVPMPDFAVIKEYFQVYFNAFRQVPLLVQLQNVEEVIFARERGAGIRADCLAAPGTTMMRRYPETLAAAQAEDCWKSAPVVFEICWNLAYWSSQGWNADEIFSIAADRYHVSSLNTKGGEMTPEVRQALDRLLLRCGYRLRTTAARFSVEADAGMPFSVGLDWSNDGNAPAYRELTPRLALLDRNRRVVFEAQSESSLKFRLPGSFSTTQQLQLPKKLRPGEYTLALSVRDPQSKSSIMLAQSGRRRGGWYPLGELRLRRSSAL